MADRQQEWCVFLATILVVVAFLPILLIALFGQIWGAVMSKESRELREKKVQNVINWLNLDARNDPDDSSDAKQCIGQTYRCCKLVFDFNYSPVKGDFEAHIWSEVMLVDWWDGAVELMAQKAMSLSAAMLECWPDSIGYLAGEVKADQCD